MLWRENGRLLHCYWLRRFKDDTPQRIRILQNSLLKKDAEIGDKHGMKRNTRAFSPLPPPPPPLPPSPFPQQCTHDHTTTITTIRRSRSRSSLKPTPANHSFIHSRNTLVPLHSFPPFAPLPSTPGILTTHSPSLRPPFPPPHPLFLPKTSRLKILRPNIP